MLPQAPQATIVITTKNRKDDLRNAVASAVAQEPAVEVLVIDDGSTDGTFEMIRREFPGVRVERSEVSRGYIVQRNAAARLATTPFIVSIDDDATFPSPRTVEQTLAEFDLERVGAVAIPFVNVRCGPGLVGGAPPDDGRVYVTSSYVGCAHAIRRDLFLSLGGYREELFHQGEERDLCTRMLDAGFVVRAGRGDPIHHFESPLRTRPRMHIFGARNALLYVWQNVPGRYILPHAIGTTINLLLASRSPKLLWWHIVGICRGYCSWFTYRNKRRPVKTQTVQRSRRLRSCGRLPIEEVLTDPVAV